MKGNTKRATRILTVTAILAFLTAGAMTRVDIHPALSLVWFWSLALTVGTLAGLVLYRMLPGYFILTLLVSTLALWWITIADAPDIAWAVFIKLLVLNGCLGALCGLLSNWRAELES